MKIMKRAQTKIQQNKGAETQHKLNLHKKTIQKQKTFEKTNQENKPTQSRQFHYVFILISLIIKIIIENYLRRITSQVVIAYCDYNISFAIENSQLQSIEYQYHKQHEQL